MPVYGPPTDPRRPVFGLSLRCVICRASPRHRGCAGTTPSGRPGPVGPLRSIDAIGPARQDQLLDSDVRNALRARQDELERNGAAAGSEPANVPRLQIDILRHQKQQHQLRSGRPAAAAGPVGHVC